MQWVYPMRNELSFYEMHTHEIRKTARRNMSKLSTNWNSISLIYRSIYWWSLPFKVAFLSFELNGNFAFLKWMDSRQNCQQCCQLGYFTDKSVSIAGKILIKLYLLVLHWKNLAVFIATLYNTILVTLLVNMKDLLDLHVPLSTITI